MKPATLLFGACVLASTAGGLALRLPRLDLRPMHADEANQAVKAAALWRTGQYRYDSAEHHGPSLYWLTLPSLWLSGARDFADSTEAAYRIVPVVFGAGLILMVFLVADGLGRGAAAAAALLTAVCPAMVFFSRYYIQEMLLVGFTFGAICCAWRYCRTASLGWAAGAGGLFGLMHATKETWVLAAAAMLIAVMLAAAWTRWRGGQLGMASARPAETQPHDAPQRPRRLLRPAAALWAVAAACAVAVALYSCFGKNWRGPLDSVLAYGGYFQRGTQPGIHAHPWYYYLQLLVASRPGRGWFWSEGLIVGLAAVGLVAALVTRRNDQDPTGTAPSPELGRFLAFYTVGLTALYCAIPYKTPWCLLSFLHAMILLAGLGAWTILRWLPGVPLRLLILAVLAAGAAFLACQAWLLNFRLYAHQRNPYVYAHTSGDVLKLAAQMEQLARVSPEGRDMVIHVVTPENYWPLPWYLRKFNEDHVGYWQEVAAWAEQTAQYPPPSVIILTGDVQPTVDAHLRAAYNKLTTRGLRPGVLLLVYVREDVWEALVSSIASARPAGCQPRY
ncbi:MAG: flippase activity-associated protein Agl23 [Thermoguttaceae bacterium]